VSRPRRHDPGRKQRILDAALAVIAEHGLAGTTHRRIAVRADVPLGSLTYHFDGIGDLCRQAFELHAARMSALFAAHFAEVEGRTGFVDALTALVTGNAGADPDDWAVALELYLAALRDPALRAVTQGWMETSRATLSRYVDPVSARGADALIEGLVIHRMLALTPVGDDEVRLFLERAVTSSPSPTS
jgi:TetR/AcrR family transcriptional regulator, regulator of biofilm formation and stress response